MKGTFGIIILIVTLFIGFLLGYSIPPFIHSGVFTGRAEKGVQVEINKEMEDYYKTLYKESEKEE